MSQPVGKNSQIISLNKVDGVPKVEGGACGSWGGEKIEVREGGGMGDGK